MEVYALIGHSGTGKSHRAPIIARNLNIEYIIDDGLLIRGSQALAGRSAKRESTRYGAIKRALFQDELHANQVRDKLSQLKPGRLMIIGTSQRMVEVIAQNLGLEEPRQLFNIEDVSSPESIETALSIRAKTNRHVIPLPTFAIKKDFPGYLLDPLRSFFSLPAAHDPESGVERSVVRPVFSTLGRFYIAEHVILNLVDYIAANTRGVKKVIGVELQNGKGRVALEVDLVIDIMETPEKDIGALLKRIQKKLKENIEYQTGFYLDQVNIHARKLHLSEEMLSDRDKMKEIFNSGVPQP